MAWWYFMSIKTAKNTNRLQLNITCDCTTTGSTRPPTGAMGRGDSAGSLKVQPYSTQTLEIIKFNSKI